MSASSNRVPYNTNGRLLILVPVALLVVSASGCLLGRGPNKERLVRELNSQLRKEQFAQLYDEANDGLYHNVTKGKFIGRMKTAVAKLKAIDPDLNFQRDWDWERSMAEFHDDSIMLAAFQKLEKDGKSVMVAYYWDNEGKFTNLWVSPEPGTSEEYHVYGVSYQHLYIGGKLIE